MEVVKLQEKNFGTILARAEEILKSGGVLAVPTDTVYGLVCDATNSAAIRKIFTIKKRSLQKALLLFVRDIAMARKYAYISDKKTKFLERVWPGAVTAVFDHKEKLPKILTGPKTSIGFRVSAHPFLQALFRHIDTPLAQTSANISGDAPVHSISELVHDAKKQTEKPDFAIDGGEITGKPSMMLDYTGNECAVIRMGAMTKEKFDELLSLVGR